MYLPVDIFDDDAQGSQGGMRTEDTDGMLKFVRG
jgi:hypothetical protein